MRSLHYDTMQLELRDKTLFFLWQAECVDTGQVLHSLPKSKVTALHELALVLERNNDRTLRQKMENLLQNEFKAFIEIYRESNVEQIFSEVENDLLYYANGDSSENLRNTLLDLVFSETTINVLLYSIPLASINWHEAGYLPENEPVFVPGDLHRIKDALKDELEHYLEVDVSDEPDSPLAEEENILAQIYWAA